MKATDENKTGLTRRTMLGSGMVGLAAASGASLGGAAYAADPVDPANPAASELSPDHALKMLKQGNRDFLAGRTPATDPDGRRRLEIARSQSPFAVLVSCSDSRVPPELLFGRGLGELFIIRNAGNTIDTVAMGSLEYAVAELKVPLVVIMGHERCGAVAAAVSVVEQGTIFPGSIGQMVEPIIPAVLQARRNKAEDLLDASVRTNVQRTVTRLREHAEPMILERVQSGQLKIVGARYDLDDGSVDFFDEG
ncbi:carbonic anhydrase [Parasphingorhabdus sp.]|uniref:carbonic anhydrase n=1 Tax=Parasphingorhabdus sp. TaxID=2709688 RepID=UPI003593E10E